MAIANRTAACTALFLAAATGSSPVVQMAAPIAPLVDHHQHLLSPTLAGRLLEESGPVTADRLIAQLDDAGIQRAAVLSLAYALGSARLRGDDEYAQVRAENDWTAQQVAKYLGRLRALCSVNPLREYALTELERCANSPSLRHGLKLHFANSGVDPSTREGASTWGGSTIATITLGRNSRRCSRPP